ncbi:MAG: hypothetical protein MUF27_17800 [Acidobacteria bacterium]|nr:hypothetical protein [Acidobacteriota bacterium]
MNEYAILHLRMLTGLPVRAAGNLLGSIASIYAEFAWIDSAMEEAVFVSDVKRDRRDMFPECLEAAGHCLITETKSPRFVAEPRIANTASEPLLLSARSGSWVVDLLGKLNPLSALESFITLGRDWSTERENRRLQNSKLAEEVIAQRLTNKAAEFALFRQVAGFLRESGVSEKEVSAFIKGRVRALAGHAAIALPSVIDAEMGTLYRVDEDGRLSTGVPLAPGRMNPEAATPEDAEAAVRRLAAARRVWEKEGIR